MAQAARNRIARLHVRRRRIRHSACISWHHKSLTRKIRCSVCIVVDGFGYTIIHWSGYGNAFGNSVSFSALYGGRNHGSNVRVSISIRSVTWFLGHEMSCPSSTSEVTFMGIMMKVLMPFWLWGVGTAIGEIPPYAISFAAAKAGDRVAELVEFENMNPAESYVNAMKKWMIDFMSRWGFWGVFIMAAWPNAAFDLCGTLRSNETAVLKILWCNSVRQGYCEDDISSHVFRHIVFRNVSKCRSSRSARCTR